MVLSLCPRVAAASDWSSAIKEARAQPPQSALASYERALASLRSSPDPDFRREITLKEMALVLFKLDRVSEAKDCIQQLLKMQEKSCAPKTEVFNTLWMLHSYEKNILNLLEAERYARAMLEVARSMNGRDRATCLATATEDLSETLILAYRFADADRLLASAEPLPSDPLLKGLKARLLLQQARVSNMTAKYDKAIEQAAAALKACPEDSFLQLECCQVLSETYLFKREYGKSIAKTEQVLALFRSDKQNSFKSLWCSERRCYLQLCQLYCLDRRSPQLVRDAMAKALVRTDKKELNYVEHELRDRIEQVIVFGDLERAESLTKTLLTVPAAPPSFIRCLKETLGTLYLVNASKDKFFALAAQEGWTDSEIVKLRDRSRLIKH